ncbi:MAG: B12-binding domain-containing radical SAM protein [Candidatus Hecatellaceae archaeon]|nr:MAG: B12-binding domain-containing radical SAM protein [Candidatus Hecatellales archaeon]
MRILLVQPPIPPEVELYSTAEMVAPSMGLAYLAAVLEQHGYKVEILDAPAFQLTYEKIPTEVERRKPDIVGVTATTAVAPSALKTAQMVKDAVPEALVVMGGPHITFLPEETMKAEPSIQIGVIGEGEYTLLDLVKTWEKNGNLKEVKGVIYRENGSLKYTEPRPLIENLDELPFPARHLLPMERYKVFGKHEILGLIFTSRGCPFNCTFCSSSLIFGKKFRARSPKNVVDEVEEFVEQYKSNHIEFVDDLFIFDKKRVKEICRELKERGLDVLWVCSARVDTVDGEIFKVIRDAGCIMVYLGVESGVQRVLNLMRKGIKVEQSVRAVKLAKEAGLQVVASFVLGIPGETWEEAMETIRFAKKLDPDFVQFSLATPFPGTELYRVAKEEGLLLTEDWTKYTVLKPVMRTEELSEERLRKLIKKAYFDFYLQPHVIWRYIRRGYAKELLVNVMGKYFWQYFKSKLGFQ